MVLFKIFQSKCLRKNIIGIVYFTSHIILTRVFFLRGLMSVRSATVIANLFFICSFHWAR